MHLSCFVRWRRSEDGESQETASCCLLSCTPAWCLPSPELIGVACVEFRAVWFMYGMGCRHGWMLWDGARAGKAKGHWRLSSVSDRENAVTTSSAPKNRRKNIWVTFVWSAMVHRRHRGSGYLHHIYLLCAFLS